MNDILNTIVDTVAADMFTAFEKATRPDGTVVLNGDLIQEAHHRKGQVDVELTIVQNEEKFELTALGKANGVTKIYAVTLVPGDADFSRNLDNFGPVAMYVIRYALFDKASSDDSPLDAPLNIINKVMLTPSTANHKPINRSASYEDETSVTVGMLASRPHIPIIVMLDIGDDGCFDFAVQFVGAEQPALSISGMNKRSSDADWQRVAELALVQVTAAYDGAMA